MDSAEGDVEVNAVLNGRPMELLEKHCMAKLLHNFYVNNGIEIYACNVLILLAGYLSCKQFVSGSLTRLVQFTVK